MRRVSTLALALLLAGSGCSHKKDKALTLNELQSKRVALTEIDGERESKTHVEVAVINEILDQGRFEIVDRASVREATTYYPSESDWQRLGKKVGADYILALKIKEFKATERKGYDKVIEEDSVLTQESGENKAVIGTRYTKVKSIEGEVSLDATFFDVEKGAVIYHDIAHATGTDNSREKKAMGQMQLLEHLTGQAINTFFEKIPK